MIHKLDNPECQECIRNILHMMTRVADERREYNHHVDNFLDEMCKELGITIAKEVDK